MDEFTLTSKKELMAVDGTCIKLKYSMLLKKLACRLNEVDIDKLKCHIITAVFEQEDVRDIIVKCDNVIIIFETLRNYHLWNYNSISKLHSIGREFIDDDEIIKEFEAYNESLVGYRAGTKIWQIMKYDNLRDSDEEEENIESSSKRRENNPSNFRMAIRKKLVLILHEQEKEKAINFAHYPISYLDNVFEKMQTKFKFSPDAVLHKVDPGSIEVTWYIPSSSAQAILNNLYVAEEFLKEIHVSAMILEDVLIYDENFGEPIVKVLNLLQLLLAVQDKNVEQVNDLIKGCSEALNEPVNKEFHTTFLMTASYGGSIDIISSLINCGANVNQKDANGWTALSYACIAGQHEAANTLIQHGADLTLTSKISTSNVLHLMESHNCHEMKKLLMDILEQQMIQASKNGNLEFVQKALIMGANVDAVDKEKDEWRSLTWASHLGHLDVVKYILAHGSNPNQESGEMHWTPLLLSSRNGHHEIVQCLLDHGAVIDQETSKGWTSLRFAGCYGHKETGRVLIHGNATVNCQDPIHGYTPLNQAAQDGHADFISMMINEVPDLDLDFSSKKARGWTSLMLASKNGHLDVVRELLLHGANPNHQKQDKTVAIHVASFTGYDKVVHSLMLHGADVNLPDEFGITALMHAAKKGNLNVVKRLMESESLDVNAQEPEAKLSAPFFAIICKNLDILQELMKSGKVNSELKDLRGKTLSIMAGHCGHKELVDFILNGEADVFHGTKETSPSISCNEDINNWWRTFWEDKIISSAKEGDLNGVRKALESGIDPDTKEKDEHTWTPLQWACEKGHVMVAECLLQHQATTDIADQSGWTGLLLASRNGNLDIVKKMLNKGANPNIMTKNGWTSLVWTAEGNYREIAKILLKEGADPNLYGQLAPSPLYHASFMGHFEIVKVLVEHSKRLEINFTTESGWSSLGVTIRNSHEEIFHYLVENGADLTCATKDKLNLLHIACLNGQESIARFLCAQKKLDANAQDLDGYTPLMYAVIKGKMNIVRLLIEDEQADLNLFDNTQKWTAVFYAMNAEDQEVLEYLLCTGRVDVSHKDVRGNTIFDLAEEKNTTAFEYLKNNFKQNVILPEKSEVKKGVSKTMENENTFT